MPLPDEVYENEQLIQRLRRAITECDAALAELRLMRGETEASGEALQQTRARLADTIASTRALLGEIQARQAELHRLRLRRRQRGRENA